MIVGGCTVNGYILDDIMLFDTYEWIMKKVIELL